ncbi:g10194 [Coccomyxa viridis]|uniref:G10194 protein n=1 Tax=Coccomyxa viridis TaxID=1274662 RepID=A0ABP1G4R6_9CHLO
MQPHRLLLSHDFNAEYADINRIAAWVKRTVMPYTRADYIADEAASPSRRHLSQIHAGSGQPDSAAKVIGALRYAGSSSETTHTTPARSQVDGMRSQGGRRRLSQLPAGSEQPDSAARVISALSNARSSSQATHASLARTQADAKSIQGGRRHLSQIPAGNEQLDSAARVIGALSYAGSSSETTHATPARGQMDAMHSRGGRRHLSQIPAASGQPDSEARVIGALSNAGSSSQVTHAALARTQADARRIQGGRRHLS